MIRKGHSVIKIKLIYVIWLLAAGNLLALLFWLFHHPPLQFTRYLIEAQAWLTNKQHDLHQGIEKIKHMAVENKANESIEPSVHFEFYTLLPNMQSMQPMMTLEEKNIDKNIDNIKKPTVGVITNAEELEREFAHHLENIRGEKK